jgi:hypothetical protein
MTVRISDKESLIFRYFLIKIGDLISNQKAMRMGILRKDSSTYESMISMTFHILLNAYDLIS